MFRIRKDGAARRGGVDLILSLTPDQRAALAGDDDDLANWLDTALVALAALRTGADPVIPGVTGDRPDPFVHDVDFKDRPGWMGAEWHARVIHDTTALITRLTGLRAAALRAHADHGGSHGERAAALGVTRPTAQSRLTQLPDDDPMELWAAGRHAPVDHPGTPVPANLRDWAVVWPGYAPVDITPPELRPNGSGVVDAEWAEPYGHFTDLTPAEWLTRQRTAALFFDLEGYYPLNPAGRTGRTGRNLPRWGENRAADALVIAGHGPNRRVLLIERDDDGGGRGRWAMPGGMVEPDEDPRRTSARELFEEAGIDLRGTTRDTLYTVHVPDWRETDRAWVVTSVDLYQIPEPITPTPGDDARHAAWWPAGSMQELTTALAPAGGLYAAHVEILNDALDDVARRERIRASLDLLEVAAEHRNGDAAGVALNTLRAAAGDAVADRMTDGLMAAGIANLINRVKTGTPEERADALSFLTDHYPGGPAALGL